MAVRKEVAITAAAIAAAGVLVAGVTVVSNASTTTRLANTGYSMQDQEVPGNGGATGAQGGMRGDGDGDHGGMGAHSHTAVTGTELDKVKAAVKAKDPAITVTTVLKDADGSYDVFGTRSGTQVRVEVSKDLKTIEVRTGGPRGDARGQQRAPSTSPSSDSTASTTSTT